MPPRERLRPSAAGGPIQHLSRNPMLARDLLRARFLRGTASGSLTR